jgi:hypothetical protein
MCDILYVARENHLFSAAKSAGRSQFLSADDQTNHLEQTGKQIGNSIGKNHADVFIGY